MLDWKTNIISPVIVAICLSVIYWSYDKVNERMTEYENLIELHPEILKDLKDLKGIKEGLVQEYRGFKAKTNLRLKDVEAKQDGVIVNELSTMRKDFILSQRRDSSKFEKVFSRLDYLKDLH
jgi:hypothetical protein